MGSGMSASTAGRVVSIHLHPAAGGEAMVPVDAVVAEADKGLAGDRRYFARRSRSTGGPTRRQVTLIGRETLAAHAAALGGGPIPPGAARSNLETEGVDLASLVGCRVRVGTAVLEFVEPRTPCAKMDAVRPGLRERMAPPGQGVLARVVQSGVIRAGDAVEPVGESGDGTPAGGTRA